MVSIGRPSPKAAGIMALGILATHREELETSLLGWGCVTIDVQRSRIPGGKIVRLGPFGAGKRRLLCMSWLALAARGSEQLVACRAPFHDLHIIADRIPIWVSSLTAPCSLPHSCATYIAPVCQEFQLYSTVGT